MLENLISEEKDSVLLGYKYNIDRSWFVEDLKGSGNHFNLSVYLSDVVPEKQILYVKYLSELIDIFNKYELNDINSNLAWYVIHPNNPYLWDFFNPARKEETINYFSE